MKKNAVFISFTLFVFAIICFAFGVFLIATPKASAMNIEYTENALDDYYALGSTLVCPQAKIKVDGNLLETKKSVLYYPDGKAIASTEFVLSNPGEYRLRYFADYNGKTVYAEDGFIVKGKAYNVSGTMSTAFYGNTGVNKGNLDGLIVSLSSGDKFVYNKPLNLNGKKKTDSIVSFYVLPERQGTADVQNVKVRLTDAVDETNYIEAVMFANSGDENEFVGDALYGGARSSLNPKYVGMHPKWYSDDKTELTFYEGNYYSIYRDVSYTSRTGYPSFAASLAACVGYGSDVDYSHAQKNQIENFNKPFSFALDYAERKLYGYSHGAGTWYSNNLIADFDDSLFFDVPWEGFTTGEAYLSIYSDMYSNSSFNFVILDIFDEDLTETEFAPESEPLIFVELPEGEIPYAIKGQPYRVFDAKAYSGCNGEIPCRSLVYRDYDTNSPKLCSVTDETFIPTDENTFYTIVYSAEDSFGNRVEKILDIPVRASREARISLTGSVDGAYTGEEIVIKQPVFEKANGNYTVSVVAALGNETYPIAVSDDGIYRFYTLKAGNYTVKYTLTDYNGPVSVSDTLTVAENPNSVYYGKPILPRVLVKGASYEFPAQYGKSFDGGKVKDITATLKYSFDDGASIDYVVGKTVKITADTGVKLIYSLAGATTDKIYEIPVTDVGLLQSKSYKQKYFYSTQFTSTANNDYSRYSTTEEAAELSYVKPVLVSDFDFDYRLPSEDFSVITITLTDTVSAAALKVKITKKSSEKLLISVNDGKDREITSSIRGKTHSLKYDCVLNTLKIDDFDFAVEEIKGFTRKNAYFNVEVKGIKNEFAMDVLSVNGQLIDNSSSDFSYPNYYLEINQGMKTIGDKIIINGFFIEDVLSFFIEGTITVKDPAGNICRTTDDVLMKDIDDFSRPYEISVNSYGTYLVLYECSDAYYNMDKGTIKINSYNVECPTVKISDTDKYSAVYAGATYKIAAATATDSDGNGIGVITVVIDTEDKAHVLAANEFCFERAGVYRVMYYAEDSFGNVGFAYYDVIAVEKEGK